MLRLSTKSRYAVSALLHLAAFHGGGGSRCLWRRSRSARGSRRPTWTRSSTRLRRAGLVQGIPGPGGGYRLTRDPEDLAIGEIIRVMDNDSRGGPRGSALDPGAVGASLQAAR
ncbi:MAG: Rrf2 family transcriptional regulator [Arhodomonas sp.]|nr:Rrf2 family transcriptional regulator [Arhodomonas sp.]